MCMRNSSCFITTRQFNLSMNTDAHLDERSIKYWRRSNVLESLSRSLSSTFSPTHREQLVAKASELLDNLP